ncbi:hypothetical protein [Noviherbaspirillum malthae]|uniref:hypothetical protein n=1 Tax=Noviherbaspirillum malthae TaxID=1260987 RepID=UPI00188EB305|nr:hypothetical protein [Noviherbaspirillum malthae]
MHKSIPIRIFQPDEMELAGAFLQSFRMDGEISAAFIYTKSSPNLVEKRGGLYIAFPATYHLDFEKVKERYTVHSAVQGEQVSVWIKDTDIEEVVSYITDHITKVA